MKILKNTVFRALRGGSFDVGTRRLRVAYRYWGEPEGRNGFDGFRFVVRKKQ